MGRRSPSNSYLAPYEVVAGNQPGILQVESAATFGRGAFTLTAGKNYVFGIDGADSLVLACHAMWDSAIIFTNMRIEDCCMDSHEVRLSSDLAGAWLPENPTTAYVAVAGAGVTATNATVAATGGAQGGAMFHFADTGARRHRLYVTVGATGGVMRVATWGKE